jgi:hypothetical protein
VHGVHQQVGIHELRHHEEAGVGELAGVVGEAAQGFVGVGVQVDHDELGGVGALEQVGELLDALKLGDDVDAVLGEEAGHLGAVGVVGIDYDGVELHEHLGLQ